MFDPYENPILIMGSQCPHHILPIRHAHLGDQWVCSINPMLSPYDNPILIMGLQYQHHILPI